MTRGADIIAAIILLALASSNCSLSITLAV